MGFDDGEIVFNERMKEVGGICKDEIEFRFDEDGVRIRVDAKETTELTTRKAERGCNVDGSYYLLESELRIKFFEDVSDERGVGTFFSGTTEGVVLGKVPQILNSEARSLHKKAISEEEGKEAGRKDGRERRGRGGGFKKEVLGDEVVKRSAEDTFSVFIEAFHTLF